MYFLSLYCTVYIGTCCNSNSNILGRGLFLLQYLCNVSCDLQVSFCNVYNIMFSVFLIGLVMFVMSIRQLLRIYSYVVNIVVLGLSYWWNHSFIIEVSIIALSYKVSASQPRHHGFQSHSGHDHDSSYGTSTGWF